MVRGVRGPLALCVTSGGGEGGYRIKTPFVGARLSSKSQDRGRQGTVCVCRCHQQPGDLTGSVHPKHASFPLLPELAT